MADDIIDAIRGREVDGLIVLPRAPRLKPGQQVKVLRGAFEGKIGIYEGMSGLDLERILLDLLGRKVSNSRWPRRGCSRASEVDSKPV